MKTGDIVRVVGGATLAAAAGGATYVRLIRPWHLTWGATDEETQRPLPGDDMVPNPKLVATHAITIYAPAHEVWPWLVQMGQGRGGFYTYDWLENMLFHLNMQNTDQVRPELQNLKVGDILPLEPGGGGPPVVILEPNRSLVVGGRIDANSEGVFSLKGQGPEAFWQVSWVFFLDPIDAQTTRLIERFRLDWNSTPQNDVIMRAFLEPGMFIMERGMLLGIKRRAEQAGAERGGAEASTQSRASKGD